MRRPARATLPGLALLALTALVSATAPTQAAAAPQEEGHQVHREVVVIGGQPLHQRVILDRLADRGYLGVQLLNITAELRQHFGAPRQSGVLVSRVAPGSPAAAAGVAVADVITAIDDEEVSTSGQLVGRISSRRQGEEIRLDIVRDGTPSTLTATLAQTERRQVEVGQFVWQDGEGEPLVFGLDPESLAAVSTVDPETIQRVITIDPETINDSVRQLVERLEAGGELGALRLDSAQRQRLEKRIADLEERLREMERQLRRRLGED